MTSSRLVLIFLGIIFLIIIILSSGRIAGALRSRFASYIPNIRPAESEIIPTPSLETDSPTPSVTPILSQKSSPNSEIPATGPNSIIWLILGSSLIAGIILKKAVKFKAE